MRSRALPVAGVNLLIFAAVLLCGLLGLVLPEPRDLATYVIVVIACPFGGLVVTLSDAFRELRAGQPKWRPLLAIGLSMALFVIGLSFLAVHD